MRRPDGLTSRVVWPEALQRCHDLPFSFLLYSAARPVNTNKLQRTPRTPVHLIKISEKLCRTATAASALLRLCLSIYPLLWQTRDDYYPGCTGDSSPQCDSRFGLQLAGRPLCYSRNTCAERPRLWQRKMRKWIFMRRNSFRLITEKVWAAYITKSHKESEDNTNQYSASFLFISAYLICRWQHFGRRQSDSVKPGLKHK